MGKQLAVTIDGKHKIGKKLFVTDETLKHRKGKKAFLTVGGVHKLVYSSGVAWKKYSCDVTEAHYEDTEVNEWYSNSWYDSTITLYNSFEYSSENGYIGIESNVFTADDDLTEAVGKYHVTDGRVIEITSLSLGNNTSRYFFDYEGKKVRERVYFNTSYSQGSISYGMVDAEEGALPESGKLIAGSVADGVCVLEINGTYFYYVLQKS